jgi:ABC-type dipeptide/oligopeptide/nickel transport system permease component
VLVIVVIYVLANLLTDIANAALDPRIARSLNEGRQG